MDFKEIKNINLNQNSAPRKKKGVEKKSVENNIKEQ